MNAKLSPSHTFETAADMRKRKLVRLREEEAIADFINEMTSGNSPFDRVPIDPAIDVALDIVGNPDQPDDAKKVIPIALLDSVVMVSCPKMPNAGPDDQAYAFLINRGDDPEFPVDIIAFSEVVDFADFPGANYEMGLDLAQLGIADGQDVQYELYVGQGSDISNPYVSNVYRIRFDKRVPGNVPEFSDVYLPDEYLESGVTKAQIEADGGFKARIIAYFGHEPDDETWLVFTVIGTGDSYEFATGRIPEPAHFLDVLVPLEFFENNDIDGRVSVALKAQDVAGNQNTGLPHEVNLLIGRSPTGFQPIVVPLHDDDPLPTLIDLTDARTPPEFIVPYYDTPLPGDQVQVTIDGNYLITLPVIVGNPGDDVAVGIISTTVIEELGAGTNGQFVFTIDYVLIRDGFTIPNRFARQIRCDLRASGWGTDLLKGIVRGPNSPADDVIPPEDSTGPLTGTIPHLAEDGSEAFETNDRVTLYKVGMDGSNPVQIGASMSAVAGDDLIYPINAGALIDGTNYVRYDNFRAHPGGANNTEVSPIWPVEVTASSGLPGGGNPIGFDHWMFRDSRQRVMSAGGPIQPSMNLRRARGNASDGTRFSGVIVRIHHYANMAQGDRIVVTVHGYDNRTGTRAPAFSEALPEYTVTDIDVGGSKATAIPEDALLGNELPPFPDGEERPPATEEKRFADIIIPYDPLIRRLNADGNIGRGSIRVSFTITNGSGTGVSDAVNSLFLDVDARTAT
ncbi:hypothetical protein [Luteibacter yeojuensis]|uniref:Uncharacterized protein n=1 Tax=Luteibacter yeojuensis TaxID=345309 RepID=A0A7X5QSK5_9GAMM|nr:hypothetical protein [Luteibacter yeojuensis]NID14535.1 hypothetical protein [Luteibacter yeojuensis]